MNPRLIAVFAIIGVLILGALGYVVKIRMDIKKVDKQLTGKKKELEDTLAQVPDQKRIDQMKGKKKNMVSLIATITEFLPKYTREGFALMIERRYTDYALATKQRLTPSTSPFDNVEPEDVPDRFIKFEGITLSSSGGEETEKYTVSFGATGVWLELLALLSEFERIDNTSKTFLRVESFSLSPTSGRGMASTNGESWLALRGVKVSCYRYEAVEEMASGNIAVQSGGASAEEEE